MPVVIIIVIYGSAEIFIPFGFALFFELTDPYLGILIVSGITLLGLSCYIMSFSAAVKEHDGMWMLDHFLAPLLASVFVLIFVNQILAFAGDILKFDVAMAHSVPILGGFGSLALGIAGIVIVFGAPVLAVIAMASRDGLIRLGSYLGFLVTGAYYGAILLAVLTHKTLPSATF